MKLTRAMLVFALASCGAGCRNAGSDYGEALCEAQLAREDVCEGGGACGAAIFAASEPGRDCNDELSAMMAATPSEYGACIEACPARRTCTVGDAEVSLYDCGCQSDCIDDSSGEYRAAVSAYVDCLEAQPNVRSGCF